MEEGRLLGDGGEVFEYWKVILFFWERIDWEIYGKMGKKMRK